MRFFEFSGDAEGEANIDKFIELLRTTVGRAASKKSPAKMNWETLQKLGKNVGLDTGGNYEAFKDLYNQYPILQSLVSDFDERQLTLRVPGVPDQTNPDEPPVQGRMSSQDKVGQIADANAEKQLKASNATPQG